jgi:hypothetical protein
MIPSPEQEFGTLDCCEILQAMRHGAMQPVLCRAEDELRYVVKPFCSGGNWPLAMEWAGARLGRSLGLPVPNYRVVDIGEELAEAWNASHIRQIEAGPGFGSQMIDNAIEPTESLLAEMDPALARRLLAFDWWMQNRDRTIKNPNLLWSAAARAFHVIDHDQAGQPDGVDLFWSLHVCASRKAGEAVWLPADLRAEFRDALSRLGPSLSAELPSAWTSRGEDVDSFLARLARTLDDNPHEDWRIYD